VTILTASRASGSSGSPKGSPSNDPYCVPRFRKQYPPKEEVPSNDPYCAPHFKAQCAERGKSPVTILTVPPSFEERCPPKERSPVRILTVPRVSRRRAPPKEEVPSNDPDCAQRFEDERPNGSGGCGENAYVNPARRRSRSPREAKRGASGGGDERAAPELGAGLGTQAPRSTVGLGARE
jgi:hypothetical protein